MRERYVIVIEAVGLALFAGTLVYTLGLLSTALMLCGVSLVVTAQIVKTR
jgi:hypothetical protein